MANIIERNVQIKRIVPVEQVDVYRKAARSHWPNASLRTIARPNERARQMSGQRTVLDSDNVQLRVRFTSMHARDQYEDNVASLKANNKLKPKT